MTATLDRPAENRTRSIAVDNGRGEYLIIRNEASRYDDRPSIVTVRWIVPSGDGVCWVHEVTNCHGDDHTAYCTSRWSIDEIREALDEHEAHIETGLGAVGQMMGHPAGGGSAFAVARPNDPQP